eukprot:507780-Rhodomonas_salina.1
MGGLACLCLGGAVPEQKEPHLARRALAPSLDVILPPASHLAQSWICGIKTSAVGFPPPSSATTTRRRPN